MLEIVVCPKDSNPLQMIAEKLAVSVADYCLVLGEDARPGQGIDERVYSLIDSLERLGVPWGVASNAGCSADGQERFDFSIPNVGVERTSSPLLVASLAGDVLLLNLRHLRKMPLWPAMPCSIMQAAATILSLACYSAPTPLACFVDSRLFVVRASNRNGDAFLEMLRTNNEFNRSWRSTFLNTRLATVHGWLDMTECVDYSHLDARHSSSLIDLAERVATVSHSIAEIRVRSISVLCRSMLNRPQMLTRAIQSIAIAAAREPDLPIEVVLLTSKADVAALDAEVARLQQLCPALKLRGAYCEPQDRPSRTALALHGIRSATTHYVWFLDDDDFLMADAFSTVRAHMNFDDVNIVIGDAVVFEETWNDGHLQNWHEASRFRAQNYLKSLSGLNHTPICSILFPTEMMHERLATVRAAGDYNEDYFLLWYALSSPRAAVRTCAHPLAGISRHGFGSAMAAENRTKWLDDFATFFGEVIASPDTGSAVFWSLAANLAQAQNALKELAPAHEPGILPLIAARAQLYYPVDGLLSEKSSIAQYLPLGSIFQTVELLIPPFSGDFVRLDLGDHCMLWEIESLVLEVKTTQHTTNRCWDGISGFEGLVLGRDLLRLQSAEGTLLLLSLGSDPQVVIPIDQHCSAQGGSIKATLRGRPLPALDGQRIVRQQASFMHPATGVVSLSAARLHLEGTESSTSAGLPYTTNTVELALPRSSGDQIKLDLHLGIAIVEIKEAALYGPDDGVVSRWDASNDFKGITIDASAVRLQSQPDSLRYLLTSPRVTMQLTGRMRTQSGHKLRLVLQYAPLPDAESFMRSRGELMWQAEPIAPLSPLARLLRLPERRTKLR